MGLQDKITLSYKIRLSKLESKKLSYYLGFIMTIFFLLILMIISWYHEPSIIWAVSYVLFVVFVYIFIFKIKKIDGEIKKVNEYLEDVSRREFERIYSNHKGKWSDYYFHRK